MIDEEALAAAQAEAAEESAPVSNDAGFLTGLIDTDALAQAQAEAANPAPVSNDAGFLTGLL